MFRTAIINITQNLESIIKPVDGTENISSNVTLKERGLKCLQTMIEKAPAKEYCNLFESEDHDIILGYLMSILCRLVKDDKSRSIRQSSLNILSILIERLDSLHDYSPDKSCSYSIIRTSLPGVSSYLFQLIMSDTKLPRKLIVAGITTLSKLITTTFRTCYHDPSISQNNQLEQICENLGIRINLLLNYIQSNQSELSNPVLDATLNLCQDMMMNVSSDLQRMVINPVIGYSAFILSLDDNCTFDISKIDKIRDCIKFGASDLKCDGLNSVIIPSFIKLLVDLEEHSLSMLHSERESKISLLYGYLRLMPSESLTILFDVDARGIQLINILITITEFSNQQPFLFLTDIEVGEGALELNVTKLSSFEKRFAYLTHNEVRLVKSCCEIIGQLLEWQHLCDILRNELMQFSSPNNLYITHMILRGCNIRPVPNNKSERFTWQLIRHYVDQTHDYYLGLNETILNDKNIHSQDILKIVISIETIVTILRIHLRFNKSQADKTLALKDIICPLLNWASSQSRAISEASLIGLTEISALYGLDSVKELIETNIDYIVDGVSQLLGTFFHNPEITGVLAITFKLSSIDSFFYFRDIYEQVFNMLGKHYNNERSRHIALLLYRTLDILSDWKRAKQGQVDNFVHVDPLTADIKSVLKDHSIDSRLLDLRNKTLENCISELSLTKTNAKSQLNEDQIMEEIESNRVPNNFSEPDSSKDSNKQQNNDDDQPNKKSNSPDIVLTEKIMKHCVNLISSNDQGTRILGLRSAARGFEILADDENTLLPIVHKCWDPLVRRLADDYNRNLEVNLCAFECLVSMAFHAKDFIKRRSLDSIFPRLCLFLEGQASQSRCKKEFGPYCMTMVYKCQLMILTHIGALAYHIQLGYSNLWRLINATLVYLDHDQIGSLREAARKSLRYMMALDCDCVWYFAKRSSGRLNELPFDLIYDDF